MSTAGQSVQFDLANTYRIAHNKTNMVRLPINITALLLIAGLAFGSIIASEERSPLNANNNSTIIRGELGPRSVRFYSALTNGSTFAWSGENFISRFEIVRNESNTAPISIVGGRFRYRLQLETLDGLPLDARVNIFSEPADHVLGVPDERATRVHS